MKVLIELGVIEIVKGSTVRINESMLPDSIKGYELYEIKDEDGWIIVSPYSDMTCPFCGRLGLKEYEGRWVCLPCITTLKKGERRRRRR